MACFDPGRTRVWSPAYAETSCISQFFQAEDLKSGSTGSFMNGLLFTQASPRSKFKMIRIRIIPEKNGEQAGQLFRLC
jgi:hypothetical protein